MIEQRKKMVEKFRKAKDKLILLDYDGTLVNFASTPDKAVPTERLLNMLKRLILQEHTKIVIITGRAYRDIDNLLGRLPIDVIAEHGAMLKENAEWKEFITDYCLWKKEIFLLLYDMIAKCPGSFVEEKPFTLTWHYRNADEQSGFNCSRELIKSVRKVASRHQLKITDGNKIVEINHQHTNKGDAALYFLEKNNYDFILAIGDDVTDEDMFNALSNKENCFTIKVGQGKTSAKYRLESAEDVLLFLEQLQ